MPAEWRSCLKQPSAYAANIDMRRISSIGFSAASEINLLSLIKAMLGLGSAGVDYQWESWSCLAPKMVMKSRDGASACGYPIKRSEFQSLKTDLLAIGLGPKEETDNGT